MLLEAASTSKAFQVPATRLEPYGSLQELLRWQQAMTRWEHLSMSALRSEDRQSWMTL